MKMREREKEGGIERESESEREEEREKEREITSDVDNITTQKILQHQDRPSHGV